MIVVVMWNLWQYIFCDVEKNLFRWKETMKHLSQHTYVETLSVLCFKKSLCVYAST